MLCKTAFLTLAPLALFAQAELTFTYTISGGAASPAPLAAGDTITYPAIAAGSAALATIYCANQSQSAYTLTASTNNAAFSAAPASVQLAAGGSVSIAVTFQPKATGTAAGAMSVVLTAASGASQVIRFTLSGQAVDGVLASIAFPADQNQTLLSDGATIAFPSAAPGTQSAATFTVFNRSSSSVSLDSLLLSGTGFRLFGLPLLPAAIASGGQLSVSLLFAPDQAGSFNGTLTWSISGTAHRVLLSGVAAVATLEFAVGSAAIQTGGTISFPSVAVGTPSELVLRIGNTGTAAAQIPTLNVSPASFQIQNAPALPLTIAVGGSATLTLRFLPQTAGDISGTLAVGTSSFILAGTGIGPQLTCAVVVRGQSPASCDGSTITLPSISLGAQLAFTVQIANTGNHPGTLQNFLVGGNGFSVAAAPSLPATLAPGDSLQVNATFSPVLVGLTGGFVQVNGQTSNLTVAATAPPALPAVTFTNVVAQMQPFTQPLVGVHLASAYPYALTGRLSLTFTPDLFIDDPAIQFLNGQRSIDFMVPAGSTDAVFGTSATGVVMQTGSSAGVIALAASFSLGSYVVTGSSPVTQNITIPAGAPQIRSFEIAGEDGAGFDVLITGFATTRSVSSLTFTFTASSNASLGTNSLTADVSSAFQNWYNSALSRSFGSQFSVTVRFNVVGSLSDLQSVSVTVTNDKGTSDAKSLALHAPSTQ